MVYPRDAAPVPTGYTRVGFARDRNRETDGGVPGLEAGAQHGAAPLLIFWSGGFAKTRSNRRGPCDVYLHFDRRYIDGDLFREEVSLSAFPGGAMADKIKTWWAMLRIGLPAGAEFALLFLYIVIVYGIIRGFGPAVQAGFGVGARVTQALFLPVASFANRGTKLRWPSRHPGAVFGLCRNRARIGHHARSRTGGALSPGGADPGLLVGSVGLRSGASISYRRAEFRSGRNCLLQLKRLSRDWQYDTTAPELDDPAGLVCFAVVDLSRRGRV